MKRIMPEAFNMFLFVGRPIDDENTFIVKEEVEGCKNETPITSYEEAEKIVLEGFKKEWVFWELDRIVTWISEHEQAFVDFLHDFEFISDEEFNSMDEEAILDKFSDFGAGYFGNDKDKALEEVYEWLEEHKELAKDFENYFNGKD